jgi:hypothetical protein
MGIGRPGDAPAYAGPDFIIARDGRLPFISFSTSCREPPPIPLKQLTPSIHRRHLWNKQIFKYPCFLFDIGRLRFRIAFTLRFRGTRFGIVATALRLAYEGHRTRVRTRNDRAGPQSVGAPS